MNIRVRSNSLPVVLASLILVAGCNATTPTRGNFGSGSCAAGDRVAVGSNAAYAIYVDENGNPVGQRAEDLKGTQQNLMCQTPSPEGPGACKAGYCPKTLSGVTYCLRC